YVGNYHSKNEGKTFEPYHRLDRIISCYMKAKGKLPEKLHLSKISFEDGTGNLIVNFNLPMKSHSNIAGRDIAFKSTDKGNHWIFESEKILLRSYSERSPSAFPGSSSSTLSLVQELKHEP